MRVFPRVEALKQAVGSELGVSPWLTIDQRRIDLFAEATDDDQWIHVDPGLAAAGPFGGTIAHGYLTLSLIPALNGEIFRVDGLAMGINYGVNKVRFTSTVPVGSRVRARSTLVSIEAVPQGVRCVIDVTIEVDGQDRPACVAQVVSLLVPGRQRGR